MISCLLSITFSRYNESGNGKISLSELKTMMEKLKAPQTHLGLKSMIKEVDEDDDGAICFREFLLIFRKSAAGELDLESGLGQLATLTEVDVDEVGVGGAKNFFEAKVGEYGINRAILTFLMFHPRLWRQIRVASLRKRLGKSKKRKRKLRKKRRLANNSSEIELHCSGEGHRKQL